MNKLYIGNLPADVNEGSIRELKAIEALNGHSFMGSQLLVEPQQSAPQNRRGRGNRVHVSNIPVHVQRDEIHDLLATFGTVQNLELLPPSKPENQTYRAQVTYETPEQAQQAVAQLRDYEYQGSVLRAEVPPMRQSDFPLRILVLSDMVGAIIGRAGGTIRQITQQSRARVDVHRKENAGSLEKVITIYGNPENCSTACQKILEVMQQEASNTNRGVPLVKVIFFASGAWRDVKSETILHCFEKAGFSRGSSAAEEITAEADIDAAAADGAAAVTSLGQLWEAAGNESLVPSGLDYLDFALADQDLVATEELTTDELAASVSEKGTAADSSSSDGEGDDIGAPQPGTADIGAPQPGTAGAALTAVDTLRIDVPLKILAHNNLIGRIIGKSGNTIKRIMEQTDTKITVSSLHDGSALHLERVITIKGKPEGVCRAGAVGSWSACTSQTLPWGAIIGTGGSSIRDMIMLSGASIKVAQPNKDDPADAHERKVTIVGTPECQWRAQSMIFNKVCYEGCMGNPDGTLRVEIFVPSNQVGRIIGKGGQTVRELQRLTRALIKLPEESQNANTEETPVHILGDFFSTHAAQRQIRALVNRNQMFAAAACPFIIPAVAFSSPELQSQAIGVKTYQAGYLRKIFFNLLCYLAAASK
ncbi:hypothetical protein MTO96_012502 [Rhipicephalus appendiculatus]